MIRSLLVPLALFLLAASGTASAAGDAAAGKAKAASCAACHGADGNSTNPEWPRLAGQNARYLAAQIRAFQAKERVNELMAPMVAPLGDQDIEDIAAYFASQSAAGGFVDQENLELGEKIWRGGNPESGVPACIACHGPAGDGNALAGFPRIAGQHAQYTAAQLEAFRTGARATDYNAMMRDAARFLTPEEMAAVAGYAAGLH